MGRKEDSLTGAIGDRISLTSATIMLGAVAVVSLAAGASAYALIAVSGDAIGVVTTSDLDNLEVEAVYVGDSLDPDDTGDIAVEITNPNDYPVEVTDIEVQDGDNVNGSGTYDEENGNLPPTVIEGGGDSETVVLEDAVTPEPGATEPTSEFTVPVHVGGEPFAGQPDTVVISELNEEGFSEGTDPDEGKITLQGETLVLDGRDGPVGYGLVTEPVLGLRVSDIVDLTYTLVTTHGDRAATAQLGFATGIFGGTETVTLEPPPADRMKSTVAMSEALVKVGDPEDPSFTGTWDEFQEEYGSKSVTGFIGMGVEEARSKIDTLTLHTTQGAVTADFMAPGQDPTRS